MTDYDVIIIGAGPAGLTAATRLTREKKRVLVLESDPQDVGGISRTITYKGFRFDIGGHRFFSKSQEVEDFWTDLLGPEMLQRPRSSKIYYRGQFYQYPLNGLEALRKLGLFEALLCVLSYLKARLFPAPNPKNFEDWVCNHFGRRLFGIFFKTYTEKVWGMDCREISADWAAQRIRGLSLGRAIFHVLFPQQGRSGPQTIKTLIDSFRYPRLGPGQMWQAAARRTIAQGGQILMGARASALAFEAETQTWTVTYTHQGKINHATSAHVISSAPLRELMLNLTPKPKSTPEAEKLRYRDFITVAVMAKGEETFKDNWIYIHDPKVKVGRVQNFKSWSPDLVPQAGAVCYGLEYFCFEGDGLWTMPDSALIELAKRELEIIGISPAANAFDACVIRQIKAYPVYDDTYVAALASIRGEIETRYPGLHLVGRNGMHKYNNQDHAMMTAMLTVKNILAGRAEYDVWRVNEDAEYHETADDTSLRQVPRKIAS